MHRVKSWQRQLEQEAEDMGYYDYPDHANPYVCPASLWVAYESGFEKARYRSINRKESDDV